MAQDPLYDHSTYADSDMDQPEVIIDGNDSMHDGMIIDGDQYHDEGEVYYEDGPMMYDADGFEESYCVYNECGSCDGHGCGS
jgi:hypothetical protein